MFQSTLQILIIFSVLLNISNNLKQGSREIMNMGYLRGRLLAACQQYSTSYLLSFFGLFWAISSSTHRCIIICCNKRIMLKQPSTNVKMTNVATIRYKINNKNFEIACYRNKALNYRNGIEEDVAEVLQTEEIFENASHGAVVKKSELNKFFPNKTKLEIIEIILSRGQLQITDKEREAQQTGIFTDIVNIIVEKCVHPITKRRFTHETIKQAIKQIHFAVKTDQPAKKQALECIKQLQTKFKIVRGDMRIRIAFKADSLDQIEKELELLEINNIISEDKKAENKISRIYDIEPNKYRDLNIMCKKNSDVTVEVIINVVVNEAAKNLEDEQFSALEPLVKTVREEDESETKAEKIEKNKRNAANKEKKTEEKILTCSTCAELAIFQTATDQRNHFKSEWHVDNVRRKSKNLPVVSEQEFKFNQEYN